MNKVENVKKQQNMFKSRNKAHTDMVSSEVH